MQFTNIFSKKKFKCDQCSEKFSKYDELIYHSRHIHHHAIVKCLKCGKEFIHEKDRLHHSRQEHEREMRERSHKESYPKESGTTQDRVNKHTNNFSDKL